MKKKTQSERAINAGISLETKLLLEGRAYAKETGIGSLSNLVRMLLLQELRRRTLAGLSQA